VPKRRCRPPTDSGRYPPFSPALPPQAQFASRQSIVPSTARSLPNEMAEDRRTRRHGKIGRDVQKEHTATAYATTKIVPTLFGELILACRSFRCFSADFLPAKLDKASAGLPLRLQPCHPQGVLCWRHVIRSAAITCPLCPWSTSTAVPAEVNSGLDLLKRRSFPPHLQSASFLRPCRPIQTGCSPAWMPTWSYATASVGLCRYFTPRRHWAPAT
jgi:hypothetical protein